MRILSRPTSSRGRIIRVGFSTRSINYRMVKWDIFKSVMKQVPETETLFETVKMEFTTEEVLTEGDWKK